MIEIQGKGLTTSKKWFCTVFPKDPDKLPQDFASYEEAKEYGDAEFGPNNYEIESPC